MLGVLPDILSQYLPDQREVLHLMFSLADAERLERLFALPVSRDQRDAGDPRAQFRVVRRLLGSYRGRTGQSDPGVSGAAGRESPGGTEEVRTRLAPFEVDGRLVMRIEMLIGAGQA